MRLRFSAIKQMLKDIPVTLPGPLHLTLDLTPIGSLTGLLAVLAQTTSTAALLED